MSTDEPLYPHLLDILAHSASQHLILAGGFGLRLKRGYLSHLARTRQVRTLISDIPEARATTDLDLFLRLEAFARREGAAAVHGMLNELGFRPRPGHEHWQFGRPLGRGPAEAEAIVDLLARAPGPAEHPHLRADRLRIRARGAPRLPLHGRTTPEAFAVEDSVMQVPLDPTASDPSPRVCVPHPYSWLCMKTVAARDWWRDRNTPQARLAGEKHAFDVYLLVAMLTERELQECLQLQQRYAGHEQLTTIRATAVELFGTAEAPGFLQATRNVGRALDFATFQEGYYQAIGI